MPAVTTSSATGSRVLQKPVVISEAARTSQPSRSEEANTEKATAKSQQANSSKRSSTSSTMSSKVKRFPTLLSRKEHRSKAETTDAANGNPRSASNGDTRRKSLGSSIRTGAPATPQSHNRSVSLASATPSSLPRPVASTGFPSSATAPNLAEPNLLNGNPQQPPSPVGFNGSPKRVPPPGQDGTSGIPRLVTSPRSVSGDPAVRQSDHTPSEAPVREDFTTGPDQLLPNASTGNETSASNVREVIASGDAKDPTAGLPASNENVASARNDAQLYIADSQGSPDPGKTEVSQSYHGG